MCLCLVGRQVNRAGKLCDGLGVAALFEEPAASIQMERGQLFLLALPCRRDSAVDSAEGGHFQ